MGLFDSNKLCCSIAGIDWAGVKYDNLFGELLLSYRSHGVIRQIKSFEKQLGRFVTDGGCSKQNALSQ